MVVAATVPGASGKSGKRQVIVFFHCGLVLGA